MTNKKQKPWEILWAKAQRMAKDGRSSLYDRVKVLDDVYEDAGFKRDMAKREQNAAAFLNAAVHETFTTFSELRAMIKTFPNRAQWANGDLLEMRRALNAAVAAKAGNGNGSAGPKLAEGTGGAGAEPEAGAETTKAEDRSRVLSWKDRYLELEKRYAVLEGRYRQLEEDYHRAFGGQRTAAG